MRIRWPRLTFPPINLWSAPHQPALEDTMTAGAERDDVQDQLCVRIDELEREKEVLAAHVERLKSIAAEEWEGVGATIQEGGTPSELHEIFHVAVQAPTASVERLKAKWQADGAYEVADAIRYNYDGEIHQDRIADYADIVADWLREQAEGGK